MYVITSLNSSYNYTTLACFCILAPQCCQHLSTYSVFHIPQVTTVNQLLLKNHQGITGCVIMMMTLMMHNDDVAMTTTDDEVIKKYAQILNMFV